MLSDNPSNPIPGDQEDPTQPAEPESAASVPLFSGICMRGPVEELERVYQNRSRGLESTGSREQLERLSRGFEIAGNRLSICLGLELDPQQQEQDPAGKGAEGVEDGEAD